MVLYRMIQQVTNRTGYLQQKAKGVVRFTVGWWLKMAKTLRQRWLNLTLLISFFLIIFVEGAWGKKKNENEVSKKY